MFSHPRIKRSPFALSRRKNTAPRKDQEVSLSCGNRDVRRIRGTSEEQPLPQREKKKKKKKKRKQVDERERDRERAVTPGAGGVHCAGRQSKQGEVHAWSPSHTFSSFLSLPRSASFAFSLSPPRRVARGEPPIPRAQVPMVFLPHADSLPSRALQPPVFPPRPSFSIRSPPSRGAFSRPRRLFLAGTLKRGSGRQIENHMLRFFMPLL